MPTSTAPTWTCTDVAALLRDRLERHGGCTLHGARARPVLDGLAVCADPATVWRFPVAGWDDAAVASWVHGWVPRLRAERLHLGAWCDGTDVVWLELVHVLPPHQRARAEAIGRRHAQQAIYDLTRDQLIPLLAVGVGLP